MKISIENSIKESIVAKEELLRTGVEQIAKAAELLILAVKNGHRIFLFGNGGSASDAQHIAAEFVNRLSHERRALPALALTTDPSVVTSIANDRSFDEVFSRQLEAHALEGDVAVAISTSGKSPNILMAVEKARAKRMKILVLTGSKGTSLAEIADIGIVVPGNSTQRIQELHILTAHILCELVENAIVDSENSNG